MACRAASSASDPVTGAVPWHSTIGAGNRRRAGPAPPGRRSRRAGRSGTSGRNIATHASTSSGSSIASWPIAVARSQERTRAGCHGSRRGGGRCSQRDGRAGPAPCRPGTAWGRRAAEASARRRRPLPGRPRARTTPPGRVGPPSAPPSLERALNLGHAQSRCQPSRAGLGGTGCRRPVASSAGSRGRARPRANSSGCVVAAARRSLARRPAATHAGRRAAGERLVRPSRP